MDYETLTDREIDVRIGVFLGWKDGGALHWERPNSDHLPVGHWNKYAALPKFSTDPTTAFDVVEKMLPTHHLEFEAQQAKNGNRFYCALFQKYGEVEISYRKNFSESPSAARAICLAALRSIEKESEGK